MLRKKARARLQVFGLAQSSAANGYGCTDRVAIAFASAQPDAHPTPQIAYGVSQQADLRGVAVLNDYFLLAVAVKVGQRKSPAVLKQIQPAQARDVRKTAVSVAPINCIAFETSPAVIGPDEFVDRVPSVLVVRIGCRVS